MPLIKLLVEGGKMTPGPAVAQQLGPMGINIGKVISDVNEATSEFKGITVPVHLNVDAQTKDFTIKVLSPPTSELIKKELGLDKASGERLKSASGNIAIEQIISVAKTKHPHLLAKDFKSAFNSVVGTCMSLGLLIENKDPQEFIQEVKEGKYDKEIESQKIELTPEKKKELEDYFDNLKQKQEEKIKEEQAEAEAAAEPAEKAEAKPEEKK